MSILWKPRPQRFRNSGTLVARTGDPHLLVELRLCVARSEARQHSIPNARQHLKIAASLLEAYPNVWLQGLLLLDESNVAGLLGISDASLRSAEASRAVAVISGHVRTRVAAVINISHILCARGDFDKAMLYVEEGLQAAGTNVHLRLAALDSPALMCSSAIGNILRVRPFSSRSLDLTQGGDENRLHWDTLTELFSRARLAQAQGRWTEAVDELTRGISLAAACGDRIWDGRMRLARSRCVFASRGVREGI